MTTLYKILWASAWANFVVSLVFLAALLITRDWELFLVPVVATLVAGLLEYAALVVFRDLRQRVAVLEELALGIPAAMHSEAMPHSAGY